MARPGTTQDAHGAQDANRIGIAMILGAVEKDMTRLSWVGSVLIALVTLVLSDIWREVRPAVFGFKWGEAMHMVATQPYAHFILSGLLLPLVLLYPFHRRYEPSLESPLAYAKVVLFGMALGPLIVFAAYSFLGGADTILDELKKNGGRELATPCLIACVALILCVQVR